VVRTLSAKLLTICHPARVYPNTEVPPHIVDLNVFLILSVPAIKVVCDKSAGIPAQVYVGKMRSVMWYNTCPIASVLTVSPVIRIHVALQYVRDKTLL